MAINLMNFQNCFDTHLSIMCVQYRPQDDVPEHHSCGIEVQTLPCIHTVG